MYVRACRVRYLTSTAVHAKNRPRLSVRGNTGRHAAGSLGLWMQRPPPTVQAPVRPCPHLRKGYDDCQIKRDCRTGCQGSRGRRSASIQLQPVAQPATARVGITSSRQCMRTSPRTWCAVSTTPPLHGPLLPLSKSRGVSEVGE